MKDLNSYWKESLSGKRIVITGGTTGIGREITILLATLGAHCLIVGRNQQQINETNTAIKNAGCIGSSQGLVTDLSNEEDIVRLFEYVTSI
jgi:NAD(P)-dependent dehydrogenase (short-subunit alcohol dehydrogenase family)